MSEQGSGGMPRLRNGGGGAYYGLPAPTFQSRVVLYKYNVYLILVVKSRTSRSTSKVI